LEFFNEVWHATGPISKPRNENSKNTQETEKKTKGLRVKGPNPSTDGSGSLGRL